MRIVINGATSMLGLALLREALFNGCKVLAIIRKNSKKADLLPISENLEVIGSDLDGICDIAATDEYDVFYQFAWAGTNKFERDDPIVQAGNIEATLRAVQLAKKFRCRKFIGAGSQAEFGIVKGKIHSDTPRNPLTAYGVAKCAADQLSSRLCRSLDIEQIWTRVCSVYGPNDNPNTLINYAIKKFIKNEDGNFSNGMQMWNFLHERDAAKMFYALGGENVDSGNYCIANERSVKLRDYIQKIHQICQSKSKIIYASDVQDGGVSLDVDMNKTMNVIGRFPLVPFESGISELVDIYRSKNHF